MTHKYATPGPLKNCQITGSENLFEIIDLGHQPLCDSLLTADQLDQPEVTYPLKLMMCPDSGLAQLSYIVDGALVYPPSYPYRSGISKPLADYQRAFADRVFELGLCKARDLVVDIGSNDGTLLTGFKALGCQVLGVEPTDVADIAWQENQIPTRRAQFKIGVVENIKKERGTASVITATNVFAHMADVHEVCKGIDTLLAPDGVFITESHYLLDVLEKYQFDTIYHEHVRTYSARSLCKLFAIYGMEVFRFERGDRYGGNIRAYVARIGVKPIHESVAQTLNNEENSNLFSSARWSEWASKVRHVRDQFRLWKAENRFSTIAGCSAPGRASTLINYFGLNAWDIPWTGELHNSLKLNFYLPGSHIPVVSNARIIEFQPEYLVLFAWHYAEPIMKRLRAEGYEGKFIIPLPNFQIVE